jgi:hypothetical protein
MFCEGSKKYKIVLLLVQSPSIYLSQVIYNIQPTVIRKIDVLGVISYYDKYG